MVDLRVLDDYLTNGDCTHGIKIEKLMDNRQAINRNNL